MARVAMIGLGRMGSGMAGRLLAAGHEVVLANRTPEKAAGLVAAGAVLAATPAEAATGAEAAIVMVSDDEASRSVWDGPEGALAGLAPGSLAIECSTLSADRVRELAAAARGAGLRYVDAPVTGLPDAAAFGQLTLLVGADSADLDAALVLAAFETDPEQSIGGLVAGLPVSHRTLIAHFRRVTGLTPRDLEQLWRFHRLVTNLATASGPEEWALRAALGGYYDQAHVIRAFHRFSGWTPTEYRRRVAEFGSGAATFVPLEDIPGEAPHPARS